MCVYASRCDKIYSCMIRALFCSYDSMNSFSSFQISTRFQLSHSECKCHFYQFVLKSLTSSPAFSSSLYTHLLKEGCPVVVAASSLFLMIITWDLMMGRPLSFVESLVAPVLDGRCPVVWQTIDALLWGNKLHLKIGILGQLLELPCMFHCAHHLHLSSLPPTPL